MAFARELPNSSGLSVAASVLVVEDDPANRVVLARGSSVP
jgi:CheY-like chemotaxis protein